jgi:DNA polymerase V
MTAYPPFTVLPADATTPLPASNAALTVYHLSQTDRSDNIERFEGAGFANRRWRLPLYSSKVTAGFPSPADDYVETSLDIQSLLVKRPAATFFVRVQGDSMQGAGIHSDDILVVDRSLTPAAGKVVLCAVNGELTVKRLLQHDGVWCLHAENPAYPDIVLSDALDTVCWGIVTNVIHAL